MLDIKWIRGNRELVERTVAGKMVELSVEELLLTDERKRRLLQEVEQLRQTRNALSEAIRRLKRDAAGDGRGREDGRAQQLEHAQELGQEQGVELRLQVQQVNGQLARLEPELRETEEALRRLLLLVPNPVSADTPEGRSDADNVELRRVGEPPAFDFATKDHVALGILHELFDLPRGVKTAGARSYYLTGTGVLLHRAVQQLTVDLLARRGFTLLEVPLFARTEALVNTGFFPGGEDQTFRLADEDRWLVGTSEVPLVNFYQGETVDVTEPIRLAAISACFRSEVGSAGRDVHGLYRVHQFAKVEQVVFCRNDPAVSETLLQEITANAEELLRLLELPYRVAQVCIGDMSPKTHKQYDIETWMPSRNAYGETHSSSMLLDFQARRAGIRYREQDGTLVYCHTLNNTAVASPRILIPLLENHQREDGSIHIPAALRPYMNGMTELRAARE